mmetsp:Transcript_69075/g.136961  ORF Transcript_69075/g.136961 Transcript_69075/m.136961 type:complete len:265 (-) Transcript_69075:613-1407(-)
MSAAVPKLQRKKITALRPALLQLPVVSDPYVGASPPVGGVEVLGLRLATGQRRHCKHAVACVHACARRCTDLGTDTSGESVPLCDVAKPEALCATRACWTVNAAAVPLPAQSLSRSALSQRQSSIDHRAGPLQRWSCAGLGASCWVGRPEHMVAASPSPSHRGPCIRHVHGRERSPGAYQGPKGDLAAGRHVDGDCQSHRRPTRGRKKSDRPVVPVCCGVGRRPTSVSATTAAESAAPPQTPRARPAAVSCGRRRLASRRWIHP